MSACGWGHLSQSVQETKQTLCQALGLWVTKDLWRLVRNPSPSTTPLVLWDHRMPTPQLPQPPPCPTSHRESPRRPCGLRDKASCNLAGVCDTTSFPHANQVSSIFC